MHSEEKDWTHKKVKIKDIRKLSEFYIFIINESCCQDNVPLMVKDKIFEERLRSYFLKDISKVTREEILNVEWNMYISKGYFIKISKGQIQEFEQSYGKDKYYVSYLEIAGPLGSFQSVCKDKELH